MPSQPKDSTAPALRLAGITKRFGPLVANDGISLSLARGEVLGLLGENGAGKSTLVNILFGHYVADAGTIEVFGERLPPGQPKAALAAGIGMVHQHFALADNMSVLDNILIGSEPLWSFLQPFSRRAAMRARVVDMAQRAGLTLQPDARVAELSVGERQRVEIMKALVRGARVLILDEPTAVLTPQESEALFATLSRLVAKGMAVVFISHKLDEVLRVCHRVAVLRAGRLVAQRVAAQTRKAELAELMVGRRIERPTKAARPEPIDPQARAVLWLRDVSVRKPGRGALHDIQLAVRAGEIVAIAGVSGNGQATLAELLSGLREVDAGELRVQGRMLAARPRDWVAARVARVPEDRHAEGVIGDLPVWENAVSERLHTPVIARHGFVRRAAARAKARWLVERFDVRLQSIDAPARTLSGGNMQKLVLGRALSVADGAGSAAKGPVLIVASQPTWGLDIGAVAFVHRCLLQAAAQGAAVLLICEDLDEIFALADRVAVMHQGRLSAARPTAEWTLAEIGLAMAGGGTSAEGVVAAVRGAAAAATGPPHAA